MEYMPVAFDKCVKRGGDIRTKTLSKNRYFRTCTIDGKEYRGEVKTKKKR